MNNSRSLKRHLVKSNSVTNSFEDCGSAPYKRRKQTNEALEALESLFKNSTVDNLDNNKFNKNDILALTVSRLLRFKYWPSHISNRNVELASYIENLSIANDLTGFIIVINTAGRIILVSDNAEHYLHKNLWSLYPQLTSIYDCISKDDHNSIRQMLSTSTMEEKSVICKWILPRGKRPNRSNTEAKSILLTGHFFFLGNNEIEEPLFIARCQQILSSTPSIPTNTISSSNSTILRFVLTDQFRINEISSNAESLLGFKSNELIDQPLHRILPLECFDILEEAKRNCLSGEHCTSMNVFDIYTSNGDRLSFLCNTHILTGGRRRAMKFGVFAQLIDPSLRYQCLIYANKQNRERQKTSMQQDLLFMSNIILNNSPTTNISISSDRQCLVKSKQQRINDGFMEKENFISVDRSQENLQMSFGTNLNKKVFNQDLNQFDQIFNWFDEENKKTANKCFSLNSVDDLFGMNNVQDLDSFIPTALETNFF